MNAGFGTFDFSSGSALAGWGCTAAFTIQCPFSGGDILLMETSFKMSLLAFLAHCVWMQSKTAWSWAMAPPCPRFDRLGWIICSSITWPKLKILQYYRTIKKLFDLCSDDGDVILCDSLCLSGVWAGWFRFFSGSAGHGGVKKELSGDTHTILFIYLIICLIILESSSFWWHDLPKYWEYILHLQSQNLFNQAWQ